MRKFLALFTFFGYFTIMVLMMAGGCSYEKPEPFQQLTAEYYIDEIVPDSLQAKHKLYVTELVKAASFHMSGGDYEDPEDVLDEAEDIANRMYRQKVEGLMFYYRKDEESMATSTFKPYYNLNDEEYKLFLELKPSKATKEITRR